MSKKENHWYILGATVDALRKSMRPRAWQIGLWLFLVALLVALEPLLEENANSPAFVPVTTVLVAGLAVGAGFALQRWRLSRARSAYLKALQHAGPEKLIDAIVRSMTSARALPDADAFSAQSRAIAYALYGRGEDAVNALAEINWGARAPLIQAVGLSAEGIVELLCRRDAQRALEVNRKARALASVSGVLPGAAQSTRYHETCVAVGEALLHTESPKSLKWLEEAAADGRFPPLQLLASFGLAVALDHSGNAERASQLRALVLMTAPHCGPLHLKPSDFSAGEPLASLTAPVSSSLSLAGATGGVGVQERSGKKKLIRAAGIVVGLWVVLIVTFAVIYASLK
jgi:hypothetical protein